MLHPSPPLWLWGIQGHGHLTVSIELHSLPSSVWVPTVPGLDGRTDTSSASRNGDQSPGLTTISHHALRSELENSQWENVPLTVPSTGGGGAEGSIASPGLPPLCGITSCSSVRTVLPVPLLGKASKAPRLAWHGQCSVPGQLPHPFPAGRGGGPGVNEASLLMLLTLRATEVRSVRRPCVHMTEPQAFREHIWGGF